MEIDITRFFYGADPSNFSASAAEMGPNAGRKTYRAACEEGASRPLLTGVQVHAARWHFRDSGAWSWEEINEWSNAELNGLFIQYISGNIRELTSLAGIPDDTKVDWKKAQELAETGKVPGAIWRAHTGEIYYSI